MNAVTAHAEPMGDVIDQGGGLAIVIERALANPATGIDVLERLLSMQERIQTRQAKHDFTAAKIAMRPHLPEVTMKGHIIIRDKAGNITQDTPFAKFEDLHEAVMPVLTDHNFDLKFRTGVSIEGKPSVITILAHLNGHEEETEFVLPHDSSGSKNSVQAVGSSTSYGKRYGTIAILNIRVVGEDDDGQSASYKDSKGEPLARTKLDGPHAGKTALKAAIQAIRNKVHACVDVKALNELLKAEKPTIDQAERDWASLLTGDPDIPEDHGLKGDAETRRAALKADGGMFAGLIASMRQNETIAALNRWRAANEEVVDALDGPEARQFQREWDAREAEIATMDRSSS
ncbi:MAG: superfamily protein [Sphingomonas bacterium]|nr:superfamily protein [Sphingomonas bacterium]